MVGLDESLAASEATEGLSLRVLRSSQTDAGQLDDELLCLFKDTLHRCLGKFHSDSLGMYYKEILVLLRSVIFVLTVAVGKPTPGMSLLNVAYRNDYRSSKYDNDGPGLSRLQRTVLYVGDIIVPYVWSRFAHHLTRAIDAGESSERVSRRPFFSWLAFYSSPEVMWNVARRIESTWMALEVINGAVYLKHGRYRRLLERMVGARMVYNHVGMSRHISFDYLNRQLIWSKISDFILFLLPLVNVDAVKNLLHVYLPANSTLVGAPVDASCAICGTMRKSPIRCQVLPCRHTFCYYCIASRMAKRKETKCHVCSGGISRISMFH